MSKKSGAVILKERVARGRRLRDLEQELRLKKLRAMGDELMRMGWAVDDPETAARKLKAEEKRAGDSDQALVDAVRREKFSRYEEVLRSAVREAVAALMHQREVGGLVSRRSQVARALADLAESKLRGQSLLSGESLRVVVASYESQAEDWKSYSKVRRHFDVRVEALANLHARAMVALRPDDVDRLFAGLYLDRESGWTADEKVLWQTVQEVWRKSSPEFDAQAKRNGQ